MLTQIYSIQTVEEALMCAEKGADNIGVAVSTGADLPSEVSKETCREIFDALRGKAKTVMIVVSDSEEPIYEPLEYVKPDILHICGYNFHATADFVARVKARVPGLEVLQAVGVCDASAVEEAKYYSGFCDYLILDSVDKKINGIGAAGFVHDWSIDRRIVEEVRCPVILAGGLGPENVAEAIRKVRPFGVDSFTKTSELLGGGKSRKDPEKVEAFIRNAKKAFAELEEA